jgi:hypothetical protein
MDQEFRNEVIYDLYKPVCWLQDAIHVVTGC